MNDDFKHILNNEDEKFLEMLSSGFRQEREKVLIREVVAQKVASTDFSAMPQAHAPVAGLSRFVNLKFIIPLVSVLAEVIALLFSCLPLNWLL